MNRLFLISGMAVFVAATFLLMNAPNFSISQAFGCSNSTSTNHTAGINGNSGNINKTAMPSGHKIGDQSMYISFSLPRSGTITSLKPCGG
jgi:hypothetical protein